METDVIGQSVETISSWLKKDKISFEDKCILVTGGAGFLGSWICDVLVRQGAYIICVDNFASGQKGNIQQLNDFDNFEFIKHDISEPIFFDRKIDVVMHLASRASPFEFARFPIQILKSNTIGTWVALGIAWKHKAKLLYTSTSEVYGDPDPQFIPTPESYNGNVNPIGPRSCYDEAKRAGEAFVIAYHIQHGLDVRIVRVFNTYGPRIRAGNIYGRVIPRFIEQTLKNKPITIFGKGTQTRTFLYVTDQIYGLLKATHNQNLAGEVINVGSNEEMRIIDLANYIKELATSRSPIEYFPLPVDDPKRRCPDITKAKRLLNWEPRTTLKEGLTFTINWFKQNLIN